MRTSFRQEAGPISRQQGKSNTQTGQLDPRTLLRKRYVIVRTIGHGLPTGCHSIGSRRPVAFAAEAERNLIRRIRYAGILKTAQILERSRT